MSDQADLSDFEHRVSFEPGEIAANVRLGKLEMMYEELFAEVIEDGIITQEERQKLDKMADSLGLDKGRRCARSSKRCNRLYEARHQVIIKELYESDEDRDGPRASLQACPSRIKTRRSTNACSSSSSASRSSRASSKKRARTCRSKWICPA